MRRPKLILLPLAALTLFLLAESASAQVSTTRGFTIGLHLTGASLVVEGDQDERSSAGGGGIHVGYGLNRRFTIFAQVDGTTFDEQNTGDVEGEWTLGHFDVGVRFNFANSLRRWVPFLQGALGYRVVGVSDPVVNDASVSEVSFSGAGLTLGGGTYFYISESFALDLQLLWTGGEFTTVKVDNVSVSGLDVDANSTRFSLGVSWWP